MRTARFLMAALAVGLLAVLWAAPAGAQDDSPFTATADPASVEAAGTYDITITGMGFTADEIAGSYCPGAEGDLEAITPENFLTLCDLAALQTDDNTDGEVTLSFTGVDVPEVGLVFLIGDIVGQEEFASTVVTVGATDDGGGGDDGGDDGATDDGGDGAADDGGDDGATDDGEELPDTGSESGLIAIIGAAAVLGGIMMVGFGRRLGRL